MWVNFAVVTKSALVSWERFALFSKSAIVQGSYKKAVEYIPFNVSWKYHRIKKQDAATATVAFKLPKENKSKSISMCLSNFKL